MSMLPPPPPQAWAEYLARGVPPAKRYLIGGNWKANGTVASTEALVKTLNEGGRFPLEAEVVIAPPFIHLDYVKKNIRPDIAVSAQNSAKDAKYGAYTGETPAPMLKDFGIGWVILGHSERREGFGTPGETDELVATKTRVALDSGLKVIACVGEKLAEREAGKTLDVVLTQTGAILQILKPEDWKNVVVAYEPVWAIGTGKVASPEQAQEVHAAIRGFITEKAGIDVAGPLRIIYGGSVKGSSAAGLIAQPDIDGFLVGGASLTSDFITIINAVGSS